MSTQQNNTSQFVQRLLFVGLILGIVFPIMAISIDMVYQQLPFKYDSLLIIFKDNPVQWIVLSAPVVLSTVFYILGTYIKKREFLLNSTTIKERQRFNKINTIIMELQNGNFEFEIDTDGQETLFEGLNLFKNTLKENHQKEQRSHWFNTGMVKLSTLLTEYKTLESLGPKFTSVICKYIGALCGCLYILRYDEEKGKILQVSGSYAISDANTLKKELENGQSLIGQAVKEKEVKLMVNIPNDYFQISSGLGTSTPKAVAVVPLISNDEVYGAFELANLRQFEPFQIEFVEKIGASLAAVIANILVVQENDRVLEDFKLQNQEMKAREEVMLQTVEELQAIQEEMERKESTYKQQIEALQKQNG